jgi:energy-coupling factor transporter ATP-binding protein EcfA2
MILKSLHVRNFRSLLDVTLTFNDLTVLVGPNGAGKSALLTAIRLLRDPAATLCETDFYNRDTSNSIQIEGVFESLVPADNQYFSRYVRDGRLVVRREFVWIDGKVDLRGSADYLSTVELERISHLASAAEKKQAYQELIASPPYDDLEPWTVAGEYDAHKLAWTSAHSEQCCCYPDEEFFGPKGAGTSHLADRREIIYVPAVQDATDVAEDSKGSVLAKLVDMVARKALAADTSFGELHAELQGKYSKYLRSHAADLDKLAREISQSLGELTPGASLKLTWNDSQNLDVRLPVALPEISEDGFSAPITHVGSGLQRACTIGLLQQLAASSRPRLADAIEAPGSGAEVTEKLPSYMFIVEEPELYQHPDRQRHLVQVFSELAGHPIAGVSSSTQRCYCTHSPLFVCMDRFEDIRLCHKANASSQPLPKQTEIRDASIDKVLGMLLSQDTPALMRARLQTIMTPFMNEGFFAHAVVLVEGLDDRAAILGTALHLGHDLEAMGIAVIPCTGKNNLDRLWAVFKTLGLPVYAVWDADEDFCKEPMSHDCSGCQKTEACRADMDRNKHLLEVLGDLTPMGKPGQRITDSFACFEDNLDRTIERELGPAYEPALADVMASLAIAEKRHAIKNPFVVKSILRHAAENNKVCTTLEDIVDRVVKLV